MPLKGNQIALASYKEKPIGWLEGVPEGTFRVRNDFYITPSEVTIALLRFLSLPKNTLFWECACGDGSMVKTIGKEGYSVIGTDLADGTNFLKEKSPKGDFIITNPPFNVADRFIGTALKMRVPFAFLLKCQYWHSKKRLDLFQLRTPKYVLPLTWRPDFLFGGSPVMDVLWTMWDVVPCKTEYYPLEKPAIQREEGWFEK
jgi:hypothetical protein